MRMNVYDWDATPGVSRRLYPLSAKRAEEWVTEGGAKFVLLPNGRRAVQKLPPIELAFERVSLSNKNLVAFGRGPLGIWIAPDKLHYETPHAGDRGCFARHRRKLLHPSHRNQVWPSSRLQVPLAATAS
jgi:hypothetical protein